MSDFDYNQINLKQLDFLFKLINTDKNKKTGIVDKLSLMEESDFQSKDFRARLEKIIAEENKKSST